MELWKLIVESTFPGTYEEYLEAKKIHLQEITTYRKTWQFIVGLILFALPLVVLLLEPGWRGKILAVCIAAGEMLVRDAISEHYCALINRERKYLTMRSGNQPPAEAAGSCSS